MVIPRGAYDEQMEHFLRRQEDRIRRLEEEAREKQMAMQEYMRGTPSLADLERLRYERRKQEIVDEVVRGPLPGESVFVQNGYGQPLATQQQAGLGKQETHSRSKRLLLLTRKEGE